MEVQTDLPSGEETDAVKLPAIEGIRIQDGQKMREKTIKIIDRVTRIVAIYLAISFGWMGGKCFVMFEGVEWGDKVLILFLLGFIYGFIVMSPLQVGLFLAPRLRQKALIWRLVCVILMVPAGIFCFDILLASPIRLLRGEFGMLEIGCIIGAMCYAIQYYLLLKDILLKPIYLIFGKDVEKA